MKFLGKFVAGVLVVSFLLQPLGLVSPVFAETVEMEYTDPDHIHAPSKVNGVDYVYDANGNLVDDGERVISWNSDNMPVRIEKDGKVVEFFYDADGRRIVKRSGEDKTVYVNQYHQEPSTKYYFAGKRIARSVDNDLSFLHYDHLGSTVLATAPNSQKLSEPLSYFPYGSPVNNLTIQQFNNLSYLFTDQELDSETDLYNFKARLYDTAGGFFISPDDFVDDPGSTVSFNRYAYGRDNPLRFVDRLGLQPEDVAGLPFFAEPSFTPEEKERAKDAIGRALSLLDPETAAVVKSPIYFVERVIIREGSYAAGVSWKKSETGEWMPQLQFARKFLGIGRKQHWVLHELGHVFGGRKGNLSQQLEFKEALAAHYPYADGGGLTYDFYDVLKYFQEIAGVGGYGYALKYLEGGPLAAGEKIQLKEAFAEAFAFYTEGSEVLGYTPTLVGYLNQVLGLEKQFPVLQLPAPAGLILGGAPSPQPELWRLRLMEQRLPEF